MKTPAIVFTDVNQVEFQDIEMPAPLAGQVTVETGYSMLSTGTETWVLQNKFTWEPWHPTPFPCVPGYQRVGRIVAIGDEVSDWQVGDRVFAASSTWDGEVCPVWGAHVALGNVSTDQIYKLPEHIKPVDAAGTIVAQVGYNAASRANISDGDRVLVIGDGIIGQLAAQAIRARGAKTILVGHRAGRLDIAQKVSADFVVNSHNVELATAVRDITGEDYVTAVIDTIQSQIAQYEYMPLLERGHGQIIYSGFTEGIYWGDMAQLQQMEITAHFVSGWTRERVDTTLQWLADKKLDISSLVTNSEIPRNATKMYDRTITQSSSFLGAIIKWVD